MPIVPGETACLRCVFPEPAGPASIDTCDTGRRASARCPASSANLAAAEAIKLLVGAQERLHRGLTWIDCWYNSFQPDAHRDTGRRTARPASSASSSFWSGRPGSTAATLCGRDAVQVRPPAPVDLDLAALAGRLTAVGTVRQGPHLVRLSVPPHELTIFRDGRAIVKGTVGSRGARSLYARYVGA